MPDYFSGYEIIAETKNFLITCEDDPGARQRAQNVGELRSGPLKAQSAFQHELRGGKELAAFHLGHSSEG